MRSTWIRVSAGLVAGVGIVVAVAFPTSCAHALAAYSPLGQSCDSNMVVRLAIVGVSLVVAAILLAFSYDRRSV